jgi:NADPH-dependent curcumin reductase CurA
VAYLGWQEYGVSDGTGVFKVDTRHVPLSAYLGPVGMPGITAWYGLNRIIEPKHGETIVVSAASGAVGSVVGQLAKIGGCRAVGIAGGAQKCEYVTKELRFDACIDYKSEDVGRRLKEVAPDGVDGYFENVGGEIMEAVLPRMNAFGRIALCGLIAGYDGKPIPIANPAWFLISRLLLRGFIVTEHMDAWPAALQELGGHVASGRIKYRETVANGIENAPQAFLGMLKGANFGKQLVKLAG